MKPQFGRSNIEFIKYKKMPECKVKIETILPQG